MTYRGRRQSGPWWADDARRTRFEREAKRHFPTLRRVTRPQGRKGSCRYRAEVELPGGYEKRDVEVIFGPKTLDGPTILADGPTDSPHRYSDHERRALCVWYPKDAPTERWMWDDGLLQLLGLVRLHLFREAYWRESGEWLGPEVTHRGDAVAEAPKSLT